jgi:hypothetical protein
MKRYFKHLGLVVLGGAFLASCEGTIGSDEPLDFNTVTNVAGFPEATTTASIPVDGTVQTYEAEILVNGPTVGNLQGDVSMDFSVDPASTAVEGIHYQPLESTSITLTDSGNYLGLIPINIITGNIPEPPVTKTLILNIDGIQTSEGTVVLSGNKSSVVININYSCFSDLAGVYTATINGTPYTVNVEQTGQGEYIADNLAPLTDAGYPVAPFTFSDLCDVITVTGFPAYTNELTGAGTVNEDGSITFTDMVLSGVGAVPNFTIVPN